MITLLTEETELEQTRLLDLAPDTDISTKTCTSGDIACRLNPTDVTEVEISAVTRCWNVLHPFHGGNTNKYDIKNGWKRHEKI